MKRQSFLFLAAALTAVLMTASCNDAEPEKATLAEGAITVTIQSDAATKATSGTDAEPCETALNSVQILVFDADGHLYRYATSSSLTSGDSQTFQNVNAGSYTVVAVANVSDLSSVSTITALQSTAAALGDNSTTATTGFRMYGSGIVTVTSTHTASSPATLSVAMSRYTSRVRLVSVTNGMAAALGSLTIDYVMLTNVLTSWTMGGSGTPTGWGNLAGRKSGSVIASASDATCADLTFHSCGQSVASGAGAVSLNYRFYSFPNNNSSTVTGPAATEGPVRLVVKASFDSRSYYYPVTIPDIARNNTYDVTLTITGPGSDDPNTPVEKGNISATITVAPWTGGDAYNETI